MIYNQAWHLDALKAVAPTITPQQPPEAAIIKWASVRNLPTEVVRKLAQVYNTALTTQHFNNSPLEKRAESVNLIDVDTLVQTYNEAQEAPEKPQGKPVIRIVSDEGYTFEDVNDLFPELKKAASVETPKKSEFKAQEDKSLLYDLNQAFSDAYASWENSVLKLASAYSSLYPPSISFDALEAFMIKESRDLESTQETMNAVQNAMPKHIKVARAKKESIFFGPHKDPHLKLAINAVESLQRIKEAQELITQVKSAVGAASSPLLPNPTKPGKEKEPNKGPDTLNEENNRATENRFNPPESYPTSKNLSNTTRNLALDSGNLSSKGNELVKDISSVIVPVQVEKQILRDVQKEIDNEADYARAEIVLANLLLQDEALANADPEDVRELYFVLLREDKKTALDITAARTILRNAVMFQGLDLSAREAILKNEKIRAEIAGIKAGNRPNRHTS